MVNAKNSKLIRIYGITLAKSGYRLKSYGHGAEIVAGEWYEYVDYFIDDLIAFIKKQDLDKVFIKRLTKK